MQLNLNEKIITAIAALAQKHDVRRVILFGSRARGDNKERSDIDLAVSGGKTAAFIADAETEIPTLLQLDIVDLDKPLQAELLQMIKTEGVTLYEKFDNFCRALINLEKITAYSQPYDTVILTGMTALYEICFEQAWKAMKEILEQQGFSENKTGSPRQVLKTAYQSGMINDEEIWPKALQARNNVVHAYNEAIAQSIVKESQEIYIAMFRDLKTTLETNWL